MNEHHTTRSERSVPNAMSPGGNSPVIGRDVPDRGRFGTGGSAAMAGAEQDLRSHRRFADLPHRTRYDETIHAGRHDSPRRTSQGPEKHDTNTLPIVAMGIGGGLILGWLLTGWGGAKPRREDRGWAETGERPHGERDFYRTRRSSYESSRSVPTDETRDLIASDKVEGTAVYDRNGERLGSVHNFMVGKRSGQVAYAVMSFGGWLGMGESYHPLPWHTLTYDTDLGGYVVSLTEDQLRNAPRHNPGQDTSADASYWRRVKDYWA